MSSNTDEPQNPSFDFDDSSNTVDSSADAAAQQRISRLEQNAPASRPSDDEIVAEYEQRYAPKPEPPPRTRTSTSDNFRYEPSNGERMRDNFGTWVASMNEQPRSYSSLAVSEDERLWASIAHASTWLTIVLGFITGGLVSLLGLIVPLVIYFNFRKKSSFVAFHALQSFALQLIATVGVVALMLTGMLVWVIGLIISALLVIIVIGFVLLFVWGLVGFAYFVGVSALPIVSLVLSTIAAYQTYRGQDYRYPLIGTWVDRQLASYAQVI
jgi:uncharacterized Tic20 family protein